jgi:endonuclease/exonuclease/phosphatase (EEP) superfamily protein YafD
LNFLTDKLFRNLKLIRIVSDKVAHRSFFIGVAGMRILVLRLFASWLLTVGLASSADATLICFEAQAAGAEWKLPLVPMGFRPGRPEPISSRFQVLIWNVYKNSRNGLIGDLTSIGRNVDLTLLQEAVDHVDFIDGVARINDGHNWTMAQAFERDGVSTGVATGSKAAPLRVSAYRSIPTEPITNTPKSMILSEYRLIHSSQTLMVLNVHAINFVGQGSFQTHVDQMVVLIAQHRGPLIVAGDFNTWSSQRLQYLNQKMESLGLKQISVSRRERLLTLDQVYSRGLLVQMANDIPVIASSDHKPIYLEFEHEAETSGRR